MTNNFGDWPGGGYNTNELENALDELFVAVQELVYSIDRLEEDEHYESIFKGEVEKYYQRVKDIATRVEELEND